METRGSYITNINYTKDGYLDYTGFIRKDDPNTFQFEVFDFKSIANWAYVHWELPYIVTVIYLITIFGIQHLMKNREAFNLKRELFWWNSAVALFSICGLVRVAPELFNKFSQPDGFYRSMCVIERSSMQYVFWGTMFALSKFVELIDTLFIVLRKKPLIVLQWYHHLITMISSWTLLPFFEPVNSYYIVLNYGVHSMMYTYFALKAMDVKIPNYVAKFITSCQFIQMVTGLSILAYSALLYYTGVPCYRHPLTIKLSLGVAISFNILFGELFYKSVIQKRKSKSE